MYDQERGRNEMKNYLTQERMLLSLSAAQTILDCYTRMTEQMRAFAREGEMISSETALDILNRNAPNWRVIQTIAEEIGHFTARKPANDAAREGMRRLRQRQHDEKQLRQIETVDSILSRPPQAGTAECQTEIAAETIGSISDFDLNDSATLSKIHSRLQTLAQESDSPFLFKSAICRALNIPIDQINPLITKLVSEGLIQESTIEGRFHIQGLK